MAGGLTTWADLGPIEGNVLVVVNSPVEDDHEVAAVFDELLRIATVAVVHLIAPQRWLERAITLGIPAGQVLTATYSKNDLELNYFLQTPPAILWATAKQFRFIIGTKAHSLYNEEIKDIFEQRVCLLLRDGLFLAHTIPHRYVYWFDVAGLLSRLGRPPKVDAYLRTCRALVDECYRGWVEAGRPDVSEELQCEEWAALLEKFLSTSALAYDEIGPIPIQRVDTSASLAAFVHALQDTVRRHAQLLDEREATIDERDATINERDATIDYLRGRTLRGRVRRALNWFRS